MAVYGQDARLPGRRTFGILGLKYVSSHVTTGLIATSIFAIPVLDMHWIHSQIGEAQVCEGPEKQAQYTTGDTQRRTCSLDFK